MFIVKKEFFEKFDQKQRDRYEMLRIQYKDKGLSFLIGKKITGVNDLGMTSTAYCIFIYGSNIKIMEQFSNDAGQILDFMADFLNEYYIGE